MSLKYDTIDSSACPDRAGRKGANSSSVTEIAPIKINRPYVLITPVSMLASCRDDV